MDFTEPPRRPRTESIVPMINVVFLLLIFFLMTSRLIQPEPFEVTPPTAASKVEPEAQATLFADKNGLLHFDGSQNDAAIKSIAAQVSDTTIIQLRADADILATQLAQILRKLSDAGLSRVELVVDSK
ncbi:MAG: biopolymer transporter ExbD [Rhodobacteraceae bacterium]|nr:MAG: biopolymer transporter ExbD [Paracoccaceae bacterium]